MSDLFKSIEYQLGSTAMLEDREPVAFRGLGDLNGTLHQFGSWLPTSDTKTAREQVLLLVERSIEDEIVDSGNRLLIQPVGWKWVVKPKSGISPDDSIGLKIWCIVTGQGADKIKGTLKEPA